MTDLVSRPPRPAAVRRPAPFRRQQRADVPQSLSLAGVLAALRATALGLLAVMVLVLVAWASAADTGASATEAVAAGLAIWLVGHLARLSVAGGSFGLAPLGLTLLLAVLLYSSAVRAARAAHVRGRRAVGSLTVAIAASYAAIAVVISLFARSAASAAIAPRPVTAFLGAGGLALIAGGAGAVRGSGRAAAWWSRVPAAGRLAVTGAAGAVCVLLAGGSLLVAAMLALHRGEASRVVTGLDAGTSGSLLVLLICVLYAPTAVVWGTSYLAGPGFAVGTGTSVAITGAHLGSVPALPLLAALPSSNDTGAAWPLMVAATLAAGLVAGVVVDRAARREPGAPISSWRDLLRIAGLTGAVTGLSLGVLAAATRGPAGPGRLAHAGPTPWWVALAAAATTALVVAAILAGRRREVFHRAAR